MAFTAVIAFVSALATYFVARRRVGLRRSIAACATGFFAGYALTVAVLVAAEIYTHTVQESIMGFGLVGAFLGPYAGLQYARRSRQGR